MSGPGMPTVAALTLLACVTLAGCGGETPGGPADVHERLASYR